MGGPEVVQACACHNEAIIEVKYSSVQWVECTSKVVHVVPIIGHVMLKLIKGEEAGAHTTAVLLQSNTLNDH